MNIDFWVGYQESVGIAKALAAKNSYEIDSNQEVSTLHSAPTYSWEELLRLLENDFLNIDQLIMLCGERSHPTSTHKAIRFPNVYCRTIWRGRQPSNRFPTLRVEVQRTLEGRLFLNTWLVGKEDLHIYLWYTCEMRMLQWPKLLEAHS